MPNDRAPVSLLHQHHTVLILPLALDQQNQLYQGVVIAPDGRTVGQYHDWQALVALLEQWLSARSTTSSIP